MLILLVSGDKKMGAAEESGWGEGSGITGMAEGVGASMNSDVRESPLSFSASMVVEAALAQDEIADTAIRTGKEEAAMRHFGKDPRDLDPRDML